MSLFSLKKTLSFSLSLSFSFFLRYVMFWLSVRFFFPLFALRFQRWVRDQACWSSLSLFSLQGEIGNHIIRLSLSLSLSYEARVLENPISLSNAPRHTKRERDDHLRGERREIDASDINSRAKEEEKKKMDWISSHRAEPQPQRGVVASKTKTHMREQIYCACGVCYLPSAPAGHASKIHSSSVALIYIYVCVSILCKDLSLIHNAFVLYLRVVVFEHARRQVL